MIDSISTTATLPTTLGSNDWLLHVKDHKKADKDGNFPMRLVAPANNFASGFPKLGYMRIRKILDTNEVDCNKRTITQASDLKRDTENGN